MGGEHISWNVLQDGEGGSEAAPSGISVSREVATSASSKEQLPIGNRWWRMKSKVSLPVAAALCVTVALAATASAGGAVRKEQRSYRGLSHIGAGPVVLRPGPTRVLDDLVFGGVAFETRNRERFLELTVRDATGRPILAYVEAVASRSDERREASEIGKVCGSSRKPLRFKPGSNIFVYLSGEGCSGGQSVPTEGTILARFSS